jgi:hypothetical protein
MSNAMGRFSLLLCAAVVGLALAAPAAMADTQVISTVSGDPCTKVSRSGEEVTGGCVLKTQTNATHYFGFSPGVEAHCSDEIEVHVDSSGQGWLTYHVGNGGWFCHDVWGVKDCPVKTRAFALSVDASGNVTADTTLCFNLEDIYEEKIPFIFNVPQDEENGLGVTAIATPGIVKWKNPSSERGYEASYNFTGMTIFAYEPEE